MTFLYQKPPGSLIQFTVSNLQQNKLYEFRVRFINEAGKSVYSQPSHRAKTNKALLPGACETPHIITKGPDFILLRVSVPTEGGSVVKMFTFEAMDLDENATREVKQSRNSSDTESYIQCRVAGLKPGGSYLFRCRAESEVGLGPYSDWTAEVKLELVEFNAKDTAAAVVAKVRK